MCRRVAVVGSAHTFFHVHGERCVELIRKRKRPTLCICVFIVLLSNRHARDRHGVFVFGYRNYVIHNYIIHNYVGYNGLVRDRVRLGLRLLMT